MITREQAELDRQSMLAVGDSRSGEEQAILDLATAFIAADKRAEAAEGKVADAWDEGALKQAASRGQQCVVLEANPHRAALVGDHEQSQPERFSMDHHIASGRANVTLGGSVWPVPRQYSDTPLGRLMGDLDRMSPELRAFADSDEADDEPYQGPR